MMLGMGQDQPSNVALAPVPPATAVAGSPTPLSWSDLDAFVAQVNGYLSYIPTASNDNILMVCAALNDARTSVANKLSGQPLPGTIDDILARYASTINGWRSAVQSEIVKRNLSATCGASAGGFSLSGVSPILLVGGALLAAALLMGGKD